MDPPVPQLFQHFFCNEPITCLPYSLLYYMSYLTFCLIEHCVLFQRHHFDLPLLDGDFPIPTVPYVYFQHQKYFDELCRQKPADFDERVQKFLNGPGGQYYTEEESPSSSHHSSLPCTSSSSGRIYMRQPIPSLTSQAVKIHTVRPELLSNAPTVSYQNRRRRRMSDSFEEDDSINYTMVMEALNKCNDLIQLEKSISDILVSHWVTKQNEGLIDIEDSLFKLATFPNCTRAVFYCAAFKTKTGFIYNRFADSGALEGLYAKDIKKYVEDKTTTGKGTFSWQVFNNQDVTEALHKHDANLPTSSDSKKPRSSKSGPRPDIVYNRYVIHIL